MGTSRTANTKMIAQQAGANSENLDLIFISFEWGAPSARELSRLRFRLFGLDLSPLLIRLLGKNTP